MNKVKPPRPKACKWCKQKFQPVRPIQPCCSVPCAIAKANDDKAKKARKEKAERKNDIMTISQREDRARKVAQEYARKRDIKDFESRGERPKCIMCGNENHTSWHGAHFVSVGSRGGPRSLHPANINLSCGQCNFFKAQGDTEYNENMVRKYGQDMVDYLKTFPLDYTMTAEEIDEIWQHYRKMIKELKR